MCTPYNICVPHTFVVPHTFLHTPYVCIPHTFPVHGLLNWRHILVNLHMFADVQIQVGKVIIQNIINVCHI